MDDGETAVDQHIADIQRVSAVREDAALHQMIRPDLAIF
jgi:hypothetical protein